MTTASLAWGSAFLAFGPILSGLLLLCYQKAQLIIVVTTSAFGFLLSLLASSIIWQLFHLVGLGRVGVLILIPGIIGQFIFRCGFTKLYHKVEGVITASIDQATRAAVAAAASNAAANSPENAGNDSNNNSNNNDAATTNESTGDTEAVKLRLELNDWACGLAAGVGFGGMHALMLYGTLLASEAPNAGTLVQDSCPGMPSLVVSALNTMFFSILDMVWMLLTFFGMRRRYQDSNNGPDRGGVPAPLAVTNRFGGWGRYLGNSRASGNKALMIVLVSHFLASMATLFNGRNGGCSTSLLMVGLVTLLTSTIFVAGVSHIYLPSNQRRLGNGISSSSASGMAIQADAVGTDDHRD